MAVQKFNVNFEKLSAETLEQWSKIPPAIATDCMNRTNSMSGEMQPISLGMKICGQARTVTTMVGDNGASHAAIGMLEPGEIMVIDARGHKETAVWGGIMTRAAMKQGIGGLIVDGAVRDADEIREFGFPTFALATCPAGPSKGFGGIIDGVISCARCPVKPGDIVIGDDDGITVIPLERQAQILKACIEKIAQEEATNADIKKGVLPGTRFGLEIEEIS